MPYFGERICNTINKEIKKIIEHHYPQMILFFSCMIFHVLNALLDFFFSIYFSVLASNTSEE